MTGVDTFPGNKSCYKAVTSCEKKDVPTLFQLFLEQKLSKCRTEFVQACDSSLYVKILCQDDAGIGLGFISGVQIFYYAVDGGEGRAKFGISSKDWGQCSNPQDAMVCVVCQLDTLESCCCYEELSTKK